MSMCKSCGAVIDWIKTPAGRSMPLDPGEFPLIPDPAGNVYGVTAAGEVIKGRTCSESTEDERWIYARISHFATCPAAAEHRKRG